MERGVGIGRDIAADNVVDQRGFDRGSGEDAGDLRDEVSGPAEPLLFTGEGDEHDGGAERVPGHHPRPPSITSGPCDPLSLAPGAACVGLDASVERESRWPPTTTMRDGSVPVI